MPNANSEQRGNLIPEENGEYDWNRRGKKQINKCVGYSERLKTLLDSIKRIIRCYAQRHTWQTSRHHIGMYDRRKKEEDKGHERIL